MIGLAIAVLAVILLLWRVFFSGPARPALLTAEVTRGDLEQTVVATGTLEPKQLVSVGAQVSGRLEALKVELGQSVHKGDLIAQIDAQTQTNTLKTARAQLATIQAQRAASQASLAKAELEYKRQQMMVAGEATSHADFEAAEAALKAARADIASYDAQIEQARVNVSTAEVNLGYTRISAPMDGVVVSIVTKQGQTVNAMQTAPTIVILAQLDIMTIKAEISEADVIKVKVGQPVYFTILGDPDHRYQAKLRQIEPAPESIVNEVSSNSASTSASSGNSSTAIYYNGLFDAPNEDGRLRALMTAQVTIILASKHDVLQIPATALGERSRDGRYLVQVQNANGRAEPRRIRVGLNNNVTAEVIEGLAAGDNVVVGEASATPTSAMPRRGMGPPPM